MKKIDGVIDTIRTYVYSSVMQVFPGRVPSLNLFFPSCSSLHFSAHALLVALNVDADLR